MIVCDVSSRNPNVMLELGLRLASKLPIVVIFDGEGSYPFDIGTIRYLGYRRDMRYYDTGKFRKELTAKIIEVNDTYKKGNYKSFLSHFKNIDLNLDSIKTETQSLAQFLENLDQRLSKFESQTTSNKQNISSSSSDETMDLLYKQFEDYMEKFAQQHKLSYGSGVVPPNLIKKAVDGLKALKKYPMSDMHVHDVNSMVQNWERLPF